MKPVRGIWVFESTLYVCGTKVKLTVSELKIIELLLRSPSRVFDRSQLLKARAVDAYTEPDRDERTVDSHMKRLRQKIFAQTGYRKIITSHYGIGYTLNRDWYHLENTQG
jgi:DNA-binding response OmpR family regulator